MNRLGWLVCDIVKEDFYDKFGNENGKKKVLIFRRY